MDQFYEYLREQPTASLSITVGIGYALWYVVYIAKRPVLAANPRMQGFLLRHCGSLRRKFWPTFWCWEARLQTILRTLIKTSPDVPYKKEFLNTSDGGHVALDWVQNDSGSPYVSSVRPTVLMMPGLTGSSHESYARHLVKQATDRGYRALVFNNRGIGGADLKTPRTYNATNIEDLCEVIAHIKGRYPDSPLLGVGVSMGGLLLTNYLAKKGKDTPMVGAMSISAAWDIFATSKVLEEPLNSFLFNRHLTENLIEHLNKHRAIFQGNFDIDSASKSRTIREFDDRFTAKQFGYPSYKEYYIEATIATKIDDIHIPYLALNSADDMFSPGHSIPLDKAAASKNVAIAMTDHGGHIGFLEGIFPRGANLMDKLLGEFADAIFKHGHEL
ncbi:hypothetical protein CAPTEDRAFT_21514 [Capitella teleta]|uniref:Phospholipase ABHD3 n=1 Tax=Capitella teleta TaxID=283909 RepID=R7TC10_CAPTE|nr:hypothetical protein CAPTEDRAFT_21514 [Capitella teleta]|eukprot:ELT88631.1 hypothetical protein CAPTEDRAFT_21514 [Capitella teleta]